MEIGAPVHEGDEPHEDDVPVAEPIDVPTVEPVAVPA
jgi:hypothetical protein